MISSFSQHNIKYKITRREQTLLAKAAHYPQIARIPNSESQDMVIQITPQI